MPGRPPCGPHPGGTWLLDVADVVTWLEDRAAEGAAAKFAHLTLEGGLGESQEEAERFLAWTRYWREDLRLQADRGEVVRVDAVTTAVAGEYADLHQALKSLPNKLAVELSGMTSPEAIQELIADELRKALKSLRGRIGTARHDTEHADEPTESPVSANADEMPEGLPPGRPRAAQSKAGKAQTGEGRDRCRSVRAASLTSLGSTAFSNSLASLRTGPLQFPARTEPLEWIEGHGYLPASALTRSGSVRLYPWQRDIFRAMCGYLRDASGRVIREVAVSKCTQVGLTTLGIVASTFLVSMELARVTFAMPNAQSAQLFAKEEVDPIYEAMEAMTSITRARVKGET